jgi:hypothetical protein
LYAFYYVIDGVAAIVIVFFVVVGIVCVFAACVCWAYKRLRNRAAVNSREPPVLLNYSQLLQKAEMESTQSQDNNIDTLHGEQVPVDYVTPPPDTLTSFPNSDHSIDPIPYGPVPHDPDTDNEHINRLPG